MHAHSKHPFEGDSKPVECSCSVGQFHTHLAVRTEDGRVWMVGENYKKKLGIPGADVVEEFRLVPHSVDHRVKSLAMGGIHSGYLGGKHAY
jgi:alpha-tubulin suppressor-like RCC1 family protein